MGKRKIVDISGTPLEKEAKDAEAEGKEKVELAGAFLEAVDQAKMQPFQSVTFLAMIGEKKGALMITVTYNDEVEHSTLIDIIYPPQGRA